MASRPLWSSQSPPLQSHHGQTHSQQASNINRGSAQSARGYLPSGRNTPNNYALNPRPNSGQFSDRPPSIPLREQTTPTLMPAYDSPDRPSSRPSTSTGANQTIPTTSFSAQAYHVHRPRSRLSVWDRVEEVKARARSTALPRPSEPGSQASIGDKRESLSQRQRNQLENDAATTSHRSQSMGTSKRAAGGPPKNVRVNKRARTAATSPSTQSIPPSQQDALAGPAMYEPLQGDFAMPAEPAGSESREVLKQLSSNIPPSRPDRIALRTDKDKQTSNAMSQHKPIMRFNSPTSSTIDELLHPDSHWESKSKPLESATVNSHGPTVQNHGPEPLVPHHGPRSPKQAVENATKQSRVASVRDELRDAAPKQQRYSHASTQADEPKDVSKLPNSESRTLATSSEPPRSKSDEELKAIKDQLVRDVMKIMKPLVDESADIDKVWLTMRDLNEMTKSRLPPEEATRIDWTAPYELLMLVKKGIMSPEELQKLLGLPKGADAK